MLHIFYCMKIFIELNLDNYFFINNKSQILFHSKALYHDGFFSGNLRLAYWLLWCS